MDFPKKSSPKNFTVPTCEGLPKTPKNRISTTFCRVSSLNTSPIKYKKRLKDKITLKVYNDNQLRRRVNEERQYD